MPRHHTRSLVITPLLLSAEVVRQARHPVITPSDHTRSLVITPPLLSVAAVRQAELAAKAQIDAVIEAAELEKAGHLVPQHSP